MTTSHITQHHRIYLLTVWRDDDQETTDERRWHFHLEHPPTGKRCAFQNLEALVMRLQHELDEITTNP